MSKSQLFIEVQNQSPNTTQILTKNFEQAFERVNKLIFGSIPIWNWMFLSSINFVEDNFLRFHFQNHVLAPTMQRGWSCLLCCDIVSFDARMSRHWVLNAAALAILPIFFHFECHGILCSMLRHWSYCQFVEFCQCHGIQSPIHRHPIHLSHSLFVLNHFFLLSITMLELLSAT